VLARLSHGFERLLSPRQNLQLTMTESEPMELRDSVGE